MLSYVYMVASLFNKYERQIKEMQRTSQQLCRSCRFSMPISGIAYACDYLCMTKTRRNCPIGWCDKYEPRKRKKVVMKQRGLGLRVEETE